MNVYDDKNANQSPPGPTHPPDNTDPFTRTSTSSSKPLRRKVVPCNASHFTLTRLTSECPECIELTHHLSVEYSAQMYNIAERDIALWGDISDEHGQPVYPGPDVNSITESMRDFRMEDAVESGRDRQHPSPWKKKRSTGSMQEGSEEVLERLRGELAKALADRDRFFWTSNTCAPVDMKGFTKVGHL
ncbi:hypothetical protein K431DRAFT_283233 [Polychaeton citri CBS 116435]|uniref:Uncharacterized protein n=1 Tax=Polychaeton citri CBS 116435 TaxID=1314669 RepID=A0A9P4QC97_9PEZI|nr:hypothetical protein K431DRAFT_283233 [Polychaeton citri CBS 116435]